MNKLAIVGSGPETRDKAPYNDNNFDIWVFNEAPMNDWCKRWDAAFQMHKPNVYSGQNTKQANYWQWLQEQRTQKIFMLDYDDRVPGSTEYPMEDALKLGGCKFFGMSMSYAVALALLQGYKHIEVWGIELSWTEYQYGVDTWHYWVGFARGYLGSDHFILHCGEKLFEKPLYGMEGHETFPDDYFENKIAFLDNSWNAAEKHLMNLKAALEKNIEARKYEKIASLLIDIETAAIDAGYYAGALGEVEKWNSIDKNVLHRNDLEMAAAKAQRDGEEKRDAMLHNGGMVDYVFILWQQTDDRQALKQFTELFDSHVKLAYDTGAYKGIFQENQKFIDDYDGFVRANGGLVINQPVNL